MLEPMSDRRVKLIVNNLVLACCDIERLSKAGYGYIYLASGFIAHYGLGGFIEHYTTNSLRDAIFRNASSNEWRNFSPGDQNYDYYHQKGEIYAQIVARLESEPVTVVNKIFRLAACRLADDCGECANHVTTPAGPVVCCLR